MKRSQLTTAIAVTAALAAVAFFFIFKAPLTSQTQTTTPAPITSTTTAKLVVQDEETGTGAQAKTGMQVTVNYTGKLQDGTVFDSSIGKQPFSFILGAGRVIPGWYQGLQGMKVGGKRLLIIPPELAYGPQQVGKIPANSTLIFEVEMLKVSDASSTNPVPVIVH